MGLYEFDAAYLGVARPPLLKAWDAKIQAAVKTAMEQKSAFLDRHLRALVSSGVHISQVRIDHHPDGRAVIVVDEMPYVQWSLATVANSQN